MLHKLATYYIRPNVRWLPLSHWGIYRNTQKI